MYRSLRTILALPALAALVFGAASVARAAKVKVWHQHRPAHFEEAKLRNTVVSSEGTLRLSHRLRPLAGLEASHVWDIVEDRAGNLYVATGNAGNIFKVTPAGKVSVAYTGQDSQVLCLTLTPDGSIYAGTGPSGRVIRIDPQGKAKVAHEGLGAYVWSLATDPRTGTVYAGTGPQGRVYRITPDGKSEVFYDTRQDHVLCVAVGPDGRVYAGSDTRGLVYRIDQRGKAFVLYQAPQSEIRTITVTPVGVFVGTSAPTKRGAGAGEAAQPGASSSPSVVSLSGFADRGDPVSDKPEPEPAAIPAASKDKAKGEEKVKPAPAPEPPSAGENSLYRIAGDGAVREVFRERAMVLSLLRHDGRLFVGTGMDGRLFAVDERTRERSEVARLDHGQILCMLKRADGTIVLGTGDPGRLYVLEDKHTATGTVTSEVFDAKLISKWGSLRWRADTPPGTKVTVAARSGNVAEPDETWSDWSEEQTDGDRAAVHAPTARFIQYRVTLSTEDPARTPSLRGIALRYMTTNLAPEVTKLESPNLDTEDLKDPKKIKLNWSAEDANEDRLAYRLYVRKEGWDNWVLLADDWSKTDYEWDTTTTPSGVYRMKVVASDRPDNPERDALTGSRISDAFVVSHAPPAVRLKVAGIEDGRAILEAAGSSPLVRLTAASFTVNGRKWESVFPADELFDSREESFQFKTESLRPGTYVVVLRVRDAAGNTGSADVVFSVQPKK